MNDSINFNTAVSNVNFTGFQFVHPVGFKEPTRTPVVKKNIINKKCSEAEQKETAIRRSLEWIFKKLGFGKKLRNAGETKNAKANNIIENYSLDEGIDLMKKSLSDVCTYFKENNLL